MEWMHVLSIVFNSQSTSNKVMAQSAWVRMIHYFGNNGDIIYRDKNLAYLTKPMCRMLSHEVKVYDIVRMAAVNTVCSLLYALIRPTTSQPQITAVWDEVIVPICTAMLEQHQKESLQQRSVDILTALFEFKTLPAWTLDRLLESTVGTEDEIAQLDPRWVKANVCKIGPLITLALQSAASRETKLQLWTAVQKSLRLASAKEIQISAETMEATAAVCTVFREIWRAPLPSLESPSSRMSEDVSQRPDFLADLVLATFDNFGTSSFTERTLSFYDDSDEITPASTPSIHDAGAPERGTGLKFIFRLFQKPISESLIVPGYFELLEKIVARAITSQKSLRKSLTLLSQCQACMLMEGTQLSIQSWKVLSNQATAQLRLETQKPLSTSSPALPLAADTDERWSAIRNMLMFGIQMQRDRGASQEWLDLAEAGLQAIEKQHGPSAIAHKLIEQLIETLTCLNVKHMLEYVEFFLNAMTSSRTQSQSLNLMILPGAKSRPEPPLLHKIVSETLVYQAKIWQPYKLSGQFLEFLDAVCGYLSSIPECEISKALLVMMPGLVVWTNRILDGAKKLMLTVLDVIGHVPQKDMLSIEPTQVIFAAVFPIADLTIRRATIEAWNKSFGSLSRVEYTDALFKAIGAANLPLGTLSLPTWPKQDPEVLEASPQVSQSSKLAMSAPKMIALDQSIEIRPVRHRSRSGSVTSGMLTRSQRSSLVPEDASLLHDTKKRKRRETIVPGSKTDGPPGVLDLTVPLNDDGTESEVSDGSTKRKRRRGPQRIQHKTPAVKHRGRSLSKDPQIANPADDVFSSPGPPTDTFTLRKRDFRNLSPDIPSDPISESSPSVHTRMRQMSSSSQDPPIMGDLLSARSALIEIHQDQEIAEKFSDDMAPSEADDEDEIASPVSKTSRGVIDSDELMQLQIQGVISKSSDAIPEELQESIDEDLFILQLERYRTSLKQGRPITPRRRERLGALMKELAKLSGDVTEAYFST